MNKEKLKQIMQEFCSKDELKTDLHKPMLQNGFYYATDAHKMIRVPEYFDLGYPETTRPNCAAVFPKDPYPEPKIYSVKHFIKTLNDVTPLTFKEILCSFCKGTGGEECDLGHFHECDKCDGDGYNVSNVDQEIYPYQKYIIHGTQFDRSKLFPVFEACEALGIEQVSWVSGSPNRANIFEANEITFLVMPMLPGDSAEDEHNMPILKIQLQDQSVY